MSNAQLQTKSEDLYYNLPWEGLGQSLDPSSDVKTMLSDAGLNWNAIKSEMVANVPNPKYPNMTQSVVVSPEAYALVKSNNMELISVVGARYKVIQNNEAFELFQEISKMGNLEIEAAGEMENGKTVWALAKMVGSEHYLSDTEYVAGYFMFQQTFSQGSALKMMFTPMRFPGAVSLVHITTTGTAPVSFRLQHCKKLSWANKEKIKSVIDNAARAMEVFIHDATEMAMHRMPPCDGIRFACKAMKQDSVWKSVTKDEVASINAFAESPMSGRTMSKVIGALSTVDGMKRLPSAASIASRGTLWGYLMSVLYAVDHVLGHQHETRLYSAWFGLNNKSKLAAFEVAKKQML